jgi:hypothetical protein
MPKAAAIATTLFISDAPINPDHKIPIWFSTSKHFQAVPFNRHLPLERAGNAKAGPIQHILDLMKRLHVTHGSSESSIHLKPEMKINSPEYKGRQGRWQHPR